MKQFNDLNFLRDYISEKRYIHTLNVVKWAEILAQKHGADSAKCQTAAALHDILKQKDVKVLLQWCEEFDIITECDDRTLSALLHGPAASAFIKSEYGIDDSEICDAVYYHTTGRAGMSLTEKIVFLADMIGEDRTYPGVQELRALALEDLDRAVFDALKNNLLHLIGRGGYIAPDTLSAYNDYINRGF